MYGGCDAALLERYPGCESRNPMPATRPRLQQRVQSATWREGRPRTPNKGSRDHVLIELIR